MISIEIPISTHPIAGTIARNTITLASIVTGIGKSPAEFCSVWLRAQIVFTRTFS
jgi:hypothetical protein